MATKESQLVDALRDVLSARGWLLAHADETQGCYRAEKLEARAEVASGTPGGLVTAVNSWEARRMASNTLPAPTPIQHGPLDREDVGR